MAFRVIARLDVKPPALVKGIHLEGVRKLGDPAVFAQRYYEQGADEIDYHDAVASLYARNSIGELITHTSGHAFVPLTVGGGIRSVEDATDIVRRGADKVCVNTAAVARPCLLTEIADVLGSQAVVLSVEAKRLPGGGWEAYTDGGREHSGVDVRAWVERAQALGAGEVLLTSIDTEGTRTGHDLPLIEAVRAVCDVPLVAHGGAGSPAHVVEAQQAGADAAAIASLLHFGIATVADVKAALAAAGVEVRPCA